MEPSEETISSRKEKINAHIIGKTLKINELNLINRECLLDAIQALYDECSIESLQKYDKCIAQFVEKYKNTILKLKRLRVNITDFEVKDIIGRGHFGEVHVVKEKQTGDIYAMKTIRKCDSLERTFFDVERDIMAFSHSPWITSLQYAFQDSTYLFFVMEYHPGGDLLTLLYRQGGTLPESAATFYIAELVLALEDLHTMGFVHRDVKPDNVLLDRCGHLKLADFGSAARINSEGFVDKGIPVGTPDYVAPEVLRSVESKNPKQAGYGVSCDYWSLGVLAYELTIGKPPFTSQTTTNTYARIINHANNLKFPSDVLLTQAYVTFVKALLTDEKSRLNGQQIKQHLLFKNLHFDTLRDQVPPYVPKITSVDDTSNFTDILMKKSGPNIENFKKKTQFTGRNLPFIGFTFTHDFNSCDTHFDRSSVAKDELVKSMKEELENVKRNLMKSEDSEEVKLNLERKIIEKNQKLENIETIRHKLERDLAASIAENTALKRTLDIERKDRAELERKALDLIKSAKTKWETSERIKIENLNLQIEQQKEKITQLITTNNMLNEQLQRALKLEDKHKESLEAVEHLNRRSVIGLESRLDRITMETKDKITSIQSTLDETIQQKHKLENELEKLRLREKAIAEELEKSKSAHQQLINKTEEAEKLVKQLSNKVSDLELEMEKSEDFKKEISLLNQKLDTYEEKIRNLENSNLILERENQCISEYKEQINLLKDVKMQNEKTINELESKLTEEKEKCSSLKKQLEDSETLVNESQQLKELRVKMWKMEKELSNVKIDKRIVERELKDAEKQVKDLNEEITRLTETIEKNKKIHESALIELNNINETVSLDLIKCKETCKHLQEKLEDEKTKYNEDKIIIEQLKESVREKEEKISKFHSKENVYKNELLSLRNSCDIKEDEKNNLINDLETTRNENYRLIRELEETKRQLENTQLNLQALREACLIIENQVIEYENLNSSIQAEKSTLIENTDKLIKDLCKAKEDIQQAKKLANEEKSARLLCENKIKRLNEDIESLQKECSSYKDECQKYKDYSNNLNVDLANSEEMASDLEVIVKSHERRIDNLVSENNQLKEETSQYLTQISALKESNFKLKQQVQDFKESEIIFKQRIEELEVTLNARINYYEERELKREATIQQQTKLIDYLQVKIDEYSQKKKTLTDKIFGHSKKENQPPLTLPVNYKNLEEQLQKQKQINKNLQEEVYKLKAELNCKANAIPKLERHKSEIISPKTKFAMEQLGRSPTTSRADLCRQNSSQRMYHNIPHRFVTKLCKKISRCDHCSKQIMLGRDVSVCKECNISVHPDCLNELKGTCGLPQEFAKHFKDSLSKLNTIEGMEQNAPAVVNVEGWIKFLSKNNVWEKCYAYLNDYKLNLYKNSSRNELIQSFDLKLCNSRKKVVLEPLSSEIGVNVAKSDLPFILKIEIISDSTCWPSVSGVFMTLSTEDREKWFKAFQTVFTENDSSYNMNVVFTVPENLYVNCVVDVTKNIKVLGTDQGLYSFYNDCLLHIDGLSEVHHICIVRESNIVIMIAGPKSVLISCDLNHLINLTQCAPCTKPLLKYKDDIVKNLDGFHFLEVSNSTKHQTLCAATSKQLVIAKYDLDVNNFIPLRIMDTAEPVSCVLFTEHTLIVGADKFFEIDLSNFKAEEFLDSSDVKLKHVIKCHKLGSFPLAILQIFDNPKEYLLCFNEFPAFVDEYGRCSRTGEFKYAHLPVGFHFIKPYLYILYFSGVEILKLTEDSLKTDVSYEHILHVTIDLKKVRYVGKNNTGIYVWHDNKIKLLQGKKIVEIDDASSIVSQSTTNTGDELDRFSFTSSIVQSLDGNLSDIENSSLDEPTGKTVTFS